VRDGREELVGIDAVVAKRLALLVVEGVAAEAVAAVVPLPVVPVGPLGLAVRGGLDAPTRQSVYNALGDFVAAGLARRIEPAGQPGRYEMRVDDNHHHLVCSTCGRVEDVDCVVGEAPCLEPSSTNGYRIHAAEVTFWGLCADCAAEA